MILKPQITKFPMKLNLGQYSARGLKRQPKENKWTERILVVVLNAILRLHPRNKERGLTFSFYICIHITVEAEMIFYSLKHDKIQINQRKVNRLY